MVIRVMSGVGGSEFKEEQESQETSTGQAPSSLACFPLPCLQIWDNPFITWNPEECIGIKKLTVSAENLWIPDIFIVEACVSGLGKASMEPVCKE